VRERELLLLRVKKKKPRRRRRRSRRRRRRPPPPTLTVSSLPPPASRKPQTNQHTAIVIFGATGAVGSALVDLLATRAHDFGMPYPLLIVAAAHNAAAKIGDKYPAPPSSAAAGNGGGGAEKPAAGDGGGGSAEKPPASSGGGGGGGPSSSSSHNVTVLPIDVDANDAAAVRRALDAGQDRAHTILGVANCTGSYHYEPLSEMTGEAVAQAVAREVLPASQILKASVHALAGGQHPDPAPAVGGGRFRASIVAISASVTHHGMKHMECFAACKGALESLCLSAAATTAGAGVRINVVAPGLIKSPASASQSLVEPAASKSAHLYPPHRLADPEEVAAAVAVALSPALLPFTTGAILPVDGGLTRVQAYEAPTVHV
jgi:NAD(P)-dependent dehydrogenase (short-subunit alcohol dehydrogenase family)